MERKIPYMEAPKEGVGECLNQKETDKGVTANVSFTDRISRVFQVSEIPRQRPDSP